jgi:hypothetical protein
MIPDEFLKEVTRSKSKVTKAPKILMGVKKTVVDNINKKTWHNPGIFGDYYRGRYHDRKDMFP